MIAPTANSFGIFATQNFRCGEILYRGSWLTIENKLGPIMLRTDSGVFVMDSSIHSVCF